jgi:wyosine [tRNA(Phe)-imidazoG37] synthetase (radical SAM superfamily)
VKDLIRESWEREKKRRYFILEKTSFGTLIEKILECQIIYMSLRASKPKDLNRITRIDYDYLSMSENAIVLINDII